MAKYLKEFENHTAYEAYMGGGEVFLPNVSYCVSENEVRMSPYIPPIHVSSVTLNKTSLNLTVGDSETLIATVLPDNADDKSVVWQSSNSGVANVNQNGLVSSVKKGSATISAIANDGGVSANCTVSVSNPSVDGHEYVEIGGLKWATEDIKENQEALRFQWGDICGYTVDQVGVEEGQKYFCGSDYKWTNDSGSTMSKYNSTDGKTILDSSDDAVTAYWGSNWRMPTKAEFESLLSATNHVFGNFYPNYGLGVELTDKNDESKKLYFTIGEFASCGEMNYSDVAFGYWWLKTLYDDNKGFADIIYVDELGDVHIGTSAMKRTRGLKVRGVVAE